MLDVAENPRAVVGGNNPPEPSPYEALKIHIDDLFETAQGFLDGEPVASEEQATLVGRLIDDARKARNAAEAQRKAEAEPWDAGKKAVQEKWTPLTDEKKGRCALIVDTAKKALAPWLKKLEDEQRAKAEAARKEAEAKAAEARAAFEAAQAADLEAREKAEAALEEARKAEKVAHKAENTRAQATGFGGRAISLRDVFTPVLVTPKEALTHYMQAQPDALKAWLHSQAEKDVHSGVRTIPGFRIDHDRVPV